MDRQRIDEMFLDAAHAGRMPGFVAMAANRDGVIYEGAFGALDIDDPAPLPLDAVYWWASMTKVCTSIAAMQLVERGVMALDAPIDTYLPRLDAPQVLEPGDGDSPPTLRPARTPITLRNLLNNTAGYGYTWWNEELLSASSKLKLNLGFMPADWEEVVRTPLLFDPGTRWNYGVSSDIAGLAIEAASGMKLGAYFTEHIFAPLGITDSTYTLDAERQARMPQIYARKSETEFNPMAKMHECTEPYCAGGGGLSGPAGDFLKLLRVILNDGELEGTRILSAESVKKLTQNQIGDLCVTPMTNRFPTMSGVLDFFPGMAQKFSLGFAINTKETVHGRRPGALAWGGLCNTYFWIDPAKGTTGLLFAQQYPFMDPTTLELFGSFEGLLSTTSLVGVRHFPRAQEPRA